MGNENTTTKVLVTCVYCAKKYLEAETTRFDAGFVCEDCLAEHYTFCYSCEDYVLNDESYSYNDDIYCLHCYADLERGEEEEYVNTRDRDYSTKNLPRFQSKRVKGAIIKSPRIFSAEIECYYPNAEGYYAVQRGSDSAIGMTGDGSLGNRGVEFQTPKLKGKNGEQSIRDLCTLLQKHRYQVNRDCGLHIHLDGRGLFTKDKDAEPVSIKQLWAFYYVFEPVLHSFLPATRRVNRYCSTVKTTCRLDELAQAHTIADVEKLWYKTQSRNDIKYRKSHKYDDSRYSGVNLHSLLSAKHLEIRYHSGTLNAVKILEWANLHATILDKASYKLLAVDAPVVSAMSLSVRTKLFFNLLGLSEKSQKYFERRQKQFIEMSNTDEADVPAKEIEVCVA